MEHEVKNAFEEINNIIKDKEDNYQNAAIEKLYYVMSLIKKKEELNQLIKDYLIQLECNDYKLMVFVFSCIVNIDSDMEQYIKYIQYQLNNVGRVSLETSVYVMSQTGVFEFRHPEIVSKESQLLICQLKEKIWNEYKIIFEDVLTPVPVEERKKDLIFLMCDQYIGELHGPTKEANKIAKAIVKGLNKKVIIINTAETVSFRNAFYIYGCQRGTYIDSYLEKTEIAFEDLKFPYFQCDNNMPDIDTIRMILNFLKNQKPEFIVSVGVGGICTNLASEIIPVIVFPLSSDVGYTKSQCYAIDSNTKISEIDQAVLDRMKANGQTLIEQKLSYYIYNQKQSHNREEFGIPEDMFLAVSVSGRVNTDFDDIFFKVLDNEDLNNAGLLIIGNADQNYINEVVSKFPRLRNRLFTTGIVKGVLEYYDMCNLYLNPKRVGGGTSAAEALFKGLPILSPDFGDISHVAGEEFCVKNYDEMREMLIKYCRDSNFYNEMANKAKKRGKLFLDSDKTVSEVLRKFETQIYKKI